MKRKKNRRSSAAPVPAPAIDRVAVIRNQRIARLNELVGRDVGVLAGGPVLSEPGQMAIGLVITGYEARSDPARTTTPPCSAYAIGR